MKSFVKILPLVLLLAFSSCKTLFQKTDKHEKTVVSEKDKLESSALLIEGTRHRIKGNTAKAIVNYANAVEKDQNNSAAFFELAKIHYIEEEFKDALIFAKRANQIDPENIFYRILLADIYYVNQQADKAIEIQKKLVEDYPRDANLYLDLAQTLAQESRFKEAIEVYNDLEKYIGFSEQIVAERQDLYLELGRPEKAIEEMEMLVKLYPENFRYMEHLASLYMSTGQEEKAYQLYELMLEKMPDNPYTLLLIADYYQTKGEKKEALKYLKSALKSPSLDIDSKEKIMLAFFHFSAQDSIYISQAYELCELLIDLHPERPEVYYIYGDFLYRDGKYKKARDVYLKSVEIDPDNIRVWEQILTIDSKLEDFESMYKNSGKALEYFFEYPLIYYYQAISAYNQEDFMTVTEAMQDAIVLVFSNDTIASDFYTLQADAYSKMEMYEKSDSAYIEAIERNPENAYALNNYSYSLCTRKTNLELAKEMSLLSNELQPGMSSFQDTYAWILYQMGNYEEARAWLEKAIKNMTEERPLVLEHYGDVLYKLGKKEEALNYWKKAMDAGEGSENLERKINDKFLYE